MVITGQRPIDGYVEIKGLYIYTDGRVYSPKREYEVHVPGRRPYKRVTEGRFLKCNLSNGYLHVRPPLSGAYEKVHRLVAEAFLPNPEKLPCINHKDGNKLNNNVINLEWVSYKENTEHATLIGLKQSLKGSLNPKAVLTEEDIPQIWGLREEGLKVATIAELFQVSVRTISRVLNYKTWCN